MPGPFAAIRFFVRFATLVRDPQRLDLVFRMSHASGDHPRLRRLVEEDPGIVAIATGPRMPALPPLSELRVLPAGTLGQAYAAFMDRDGLVPDVLDHGHPDTLEGRARRHLELSHDLWHVVTGFGPDLIGELGLQAFYLAQFPAFLSFPALSAGLLHVLLYRPEDYRHVMDAIASGWTRGKEAERLVGYDWHAALSRPLAHVQEELALGGVRTAGPGSGPRQTPADPRCARTGHPFGEGGSLALHAG